MLRVDLSTLSAYDGETAIIKYGIPVGFMLPDDIISMEQIETLYAEYKRSVPDDGESSLRTDSKFFKAVPLSELTDKELVMNEDRAAAKEKLELAVLIGISNGTLLYPDETKTKWFVKSQTDPDLVFMRSWWEARRTNDAQKMQMPKEVKEAKRMILTRRTQGTEGALQMIRHMSRGDYDEWFNNKPYRYCVDRIMSDLSSNLFCNDTAKVALAVVSDYCEQISICLRNQTPKGIYTDKNGKSVEYIKVPYGKMKLALSQENDTPEGIVSLETFIKDIAMDLMEMNTVVQKQMPTIKKNQAVLESFKNFFNAPGRTKFARFNICDEFKTYFKKRGLKLTILYLQYTANYVIHYATGIKSFMIGQSEIKIYDDHGITLTTQSYRDIDKLVNRYPIDLVWNSINDFLRSTGIGSILSGDELPIDEHGKKVGNTFKQLLCMSDDIYNRKKI